MIKKIGIRAVCATVVAQIATASCLLFASVAVHADDLFKVSSPDGTINVNVEVGDTVAYSVTVDGKTVLRPSRLSMTLADGVKLGAAPELIGQNTRSVNQVLEPVLRVKSAEIIDSFNELKLDFSGNYSVVFRAFDNGVSYRFETNLPGDITVQSEGVEFLLSEGSSTYFPKEDKFESHNERTYLVKKVADLTNDDLGSLPVLATSSGVKLLISETDLRDYAGMWVRGTSRNSFSAVFPKRALKTKMDETRRWDRNEYVTERADHIAKTAGTRTFPWRFIAIARDDADLVTNQLSFQLASPLEIKDPSWIKPGNVAWDWWNYNNVYGVDFRAGVNTETYKYYIDFAADYGLDYIIMDEGWYRLGDLLDVVPEIDVQEIIDYGKQKGVGVIMWVIWKTLDEQLDEAMDQFEKWGAAGLKIDFMQRDDQWMVNYYWRMAEAAAKRKLLVNFHGAYKPAGIRRAYPNVLTREGLKGLEHNKWAKTITPTHNLTIPFIRMVAGPMDYTPGAMVNSSVENFRIVFNRPMSMGTRAHQMAMFVVYESPMQMLADNPSNYRKEHESAVFLGKVPAVWDETKVLSAKIADHIVIARRSGDDWYLAAMTNEQSRSLEVDLSFLQGGGFKMVSFEDGVNADRYASDYKRREQNVSAEDTLTLKLAPGGGWVARLER
ncbi:MAG: glycoside hydrolase family 97 protein [Kordiimonas sp.]